MNFIKLTSSDGEKTLVNLNKVDIIRPHNMNNFRNVTSTRIFFRGSDDYIEVLEPVEEIEKMIDLVQNFGGVNYHD